MNALHSPEASSGALLCVSQRGKLLTIARHSSYEDAEPVEPYPSSSVGEGQLRLARGGMKDVMPRYPMHLFSLKELPKGELPVVITASSPSPRTTFVSAPPGVTAAWGMIAFTPLLELATVKPVISIEAFSARTAIYSLSGLVPEGPPARLTIRILPA